MHYVTHLHQPTPSLLSQTLCFWSEMTLHHIDVLLHIFEGSGAVLFFDFQKSLTALLEQLNTLDACHPSTSTLPLDKAPTPDGRSRSTSSSPFKTSSTTVKGELNQFLAINQQFISLLERLKFEGFNGYPILLEIIYFFLLEATYAQNLFTSIAYEKQRSSVPFRMSFTFNTKNPLAITYTHLYFLATISTHHTSIVLTISPLEILLPDTTRNMIHNYKNQFNALTFDTSQCFSHLTSSDLSRLLNAFIPLNTSLIEVLEEFRRPSSTAFPRQIKEQLPDIFFEMLLHFIATHHYFDSLCKDLLGTL